jgi:OFA family oxalate/formate antiporter-like MFS transporter
MIAIGGVLVGAGWIGAGKARTVTELVVFYTLGGVGAGVVYGGTIGNALKWFPDHRGLCVGLTAGAYGVGTALTVAPIAYMIKHSGYAHTLVTWGIIQGVVVIAAAAFIVRPPTGWTPPGWAQNEAKVKAHVHTSSRDCTPREMVRTGPFWHIYVMMTMLAFGGLVVTAQLSPIATYYHVDKVVVAFGISALVLAIEVNRILNGLTRPFWVCV